MSPSHIIQSKEIGPAFPDYIQSAGGIASKLILPFRNATNASAPAQSHDPTYQKFLPAFSDGLYGENRLTVGLSTSWVIDISQLYRDDADAYVASNLVPPARLEIHDLSDSDATQTPIALNPLWTNVRVIWIRLHISAAIFTAFDDIITVYEGSSDMRGRLVSTIRGGDNKPLQRESTYTRTSEYARLHNASIALLEDPRLIEIPVYSAIATVLFNSRKVGGNHFYSTYSYDFDCPPNYVYDRYTDPTAPQCKPERIIYRVSSSLQSGVHTVSTAAMAFILVVAGILAWHWNSSVFKAASRWFMLLILFMLLAMALGAMLYSAIPQPNSEIGSAICIGRPWLTCLPLAVILAVLLAKNARLHAIYTSTQLRQNVYTDLDMLTAVTCVALVQAILLAFFSGLPLSKPVLQLGAGGFNDRLLQQCSQESGFMEWVYAEVAFIGCLILPAAWLGWKTRDLPCEFRESSHIQNAIILLAFFGAIVLPLVILVQDDPSACMLIQGLGQAFLCLVLSMILFAPKLYYLFQRHTKDLTMQSCSEDDENGTVHPHPCGNKSNLRQSNDSRSRLGSPELESRTNGPNHGSLLTHQAGRPTMRPSTPIGIEPMPMELGSFHRSPSASANPTPNPNPSPRPSPPRQRTISNHFHYPMPQAHHHVNRQMIVPSPPNSHHAPPGLILVPASLHSATAPPSADNNTVVFLPPMKSSTARLLPLPNIELEPTLTVPIAEHEGYLNQINELPTDVIRMAEIDIPVHGPIDEMSFTHDSSEPPLHLSEVEFDHLPTNEDMLAEEQDIASPSIVSPPPPRQLTSRPPPMTPVLSPISSRLSSLNHFRVLHRPTIHTIPTSHTGMVKGRSTPITPLAMNPLDPIPASPQLTESSTPNSPSSLNLRHRHQTETQIQTQSTEQESHSTVDRFRLTST